MFRLIKMAVYGTLAYFAYEFIVGLINGRDLPAVLPKRSTVEPGHQAFSGHGEGSEVKVAAAGGGYRRQKVGRGVVS